jgi:hypothetical protein
VRLGSKGQAERTTSAVLIACPTSRSCASITRSANGPTMLPRRGSVPGKIANEACVALAWIYLRLLTIVRPSRQRHRCASWGMFLGRR